MQSIQAWSWQINARGVTGFPDLCWREIGTVVVAPLLVHPQSHKSVPSRGVTFRHHLRLRNCIIHMFCVGFLDVFFSFLFVMAVTGRPHFGSKKL